jgi:hypothetical protein
MGVQDLQQKIYVAKEEQGLTVEAIAVQLNTERNPDLPVVRMPEEDLTWGDAALVVMKNTAGQVVEAGIVTGISKGRLMDNFCQKFQISQIPCSTFFTTVIAVTAQELPTLPGKSSVTLLLIFRWDITIAFPIFPMARSFTFLTTAARRRS